MREIKAIMTRSQVKQAGGEIVYSERHGEVTLQLWKLPAGSHPAYMIGDDWYNDNMALLYRPGDYPDLGFVKRAQKAINQEAQS